MELPLESDAADQGNRQLLEQRRGGIGRPEIDLVDTQVQVSGPLGVGSSGAVMGVDAVDARQEA